MKTFHFTSKEIRNNSIRLLWIGQYSTKDMFIEMAKKGYTDASAHVSQRNLIDALDSFGMPMDTLNAYNVPSDYADAIIEGNVWSRKNGSKDVSVRFKNIKYIAHLLRAFALRNEAKKWAVKYRPQKLIVFIYGIQSSLLTAAIRIKHLAEDVHLCLIAPDLPQYMDLEMSTFKKVLKWFDWQVIKRQVRAIDSFILYTESMAQVLSVPEHKWLRMEGSISIETILDNPALSHNHIKNTVMYSGKLDKRFGILELLQAIELISDENYEFWFTGSGNALCEIEKMSKKDSRIKYLGFLPSRDAILRKQQEASMLINMRLPNEPSSSYSFPSKLFEYMLSGKPVLSPRLAGIPKEYYQYLIEIPSTRPSDIADAIKRTAAFSESERHQIGKMAKEYILKYKTSIIQTQRILEFLQSQLRKDIEDKCISLQ